MTKYFFYALILLSNFYRCDPVYAQCLCLNNHEIWIGTSVSGQLLSSDINLAGNIYDPDALAYRQRVSLDTGTIYNFDSLNAYIVRAKNEGWYDSVSVWLAADFGVKIYGTDSVKKWYDIKNNDASQTAATKYPRWFADTINHKPIIKFDGTNDFLNITDNASYKTSYIHLFLVIRALTNWTNKSVVGYPHDVTHISPFYRWVFYESLDAIFVRVDSDLGGPTAGVARLNFWNIWAYQNNTRDIYRNDTLFYDGVSRIISYPNPIGIYIGANIAGGENYQGNISEIIICKQGLTTATQTLIDSYLNSKYLVY